MKKLIAKISAILTAAVMFVTAAAIPVSADTAKTVPDTECMRFVDSLGAGWNLGNAFEAADDQWVSGEMDYEGAWLPDRSIRTTKALIQTVKKAGFSTIRLPVSWHNHVDKNYKISDKWLARYKEVVDWCIDEGMYVIVNVHHDVKKGYYYPTSDELTTSKKFMKKIWEQLCDTFGSYDEHILFEAINEPRPSESEYEWWYPDWSIPDEVKDSLECINKLNQTFTVRKSGGKNKNRYLLVGGYDTDGTKKGILSKYFKMPTDTVKNKLIANVHYYCYDLKFEKSLIDNLYDTFVAKGIPVVFSEFGLKENKDDAEGFYLYDRTAESAKTLGEIASYARKHGISCLYWDNNHGAKGVYGFKIIDRKTAKVDLPTIVKAIVDGGKPAFTQKTASVESKPKVTATAAKTKVQLKWKKIDGATKYAVYQYKSGKFTKVKTVTGTSAVIKSLTSGRTYQFIVRAYVNGKWTTMKTTDIVKVTTKK